MKAKKLIILFLLFLIHGIGFAQLSPGDLSKAHAQLEGISNCTKCHVFGEKVGNNKCLDCHKFIKAGIDQQKGFHASSKVKGKDCIECHSDHHGRKFDMIHFDEKKFDHKLTGFELQGAHAQKECKECHRKKFIDNKEIAKREKTFLGLRTKCIACHEDVHKNSLSSNNCTDCHNNDKFAPATKFNHAKTKFPLQGKHQEVDCEKCHKIEITNGKKFQQFVGIKFNKCTDCHKDEHNNKFGQDCRKCHNLNSFRTIKSLTNFDHNKTNFKLLGKHVNVDCKKCHKESYTKRIAYQQCNSCHQDYHKGEMNRNNYSPDCKSCHNVYGFKPSTYTIEAHNKSQFKLDGAHMATPCFACHLKNDRMQFKRIGEKCVDCHENIHKGFIGEKYIPEQNCKACHTADTWHSPKFDHNKTDFKIEGAHEKLSCRDCHFKNSTPQKRIQKFTGFDQDCLSCHKDEHHKQFEVNGKTECLRCHQTNNWKIQDFNHDKTAFKLDGKHAKASCNACHKPIQVNNSFYKQYKFKDFSCASCH